MTVSKARRFARLDELSQIVDAGVKARKEAAEIARGLLADDVPVPEIAEHAPYSEPWLRAERAGMSRRGEIKKEIQ